MGAVADLVDNSKAVVKLADNFLRWAATSALKRVVALAFVGTLLEGGFYFYVSSLENEEKESIKTVQENVNFALLDSLYQTVIDWTKLCIETREQKNANAEWYCEQSVALYKLRSNGTPPSLRDEIINRKAYGAIILDMSSQLRGIEINKLYKQEPTEVQQLLDKILGKTGMALIFMCAAFLLSATASALNWYRKRSAQCTPARMERT